MILPIYIYGQPVLRKVAEDVELNKEELDPLIADMYDTLKVSEGVGLAAPQIGKAIRVVVVDLSMLAEDMPEYKDFRHAYINGHIVEASEANRTAWRAASACPASLRKSPGPAACAYSITTSCFSPTTNGLTDFWPVCCNMSTTI